VPIASVVSLTSQSTARSTPPLTASGPRPTPTSTCVPPRTHRSLTPTPTIRSPASPTAAAVGALGRIPSS
jgi:hypothetical protein